MANRFVRESLLQKRVNHKVRCHVCERRCTLGIGSYGWCRARQNRHGRLQTLTYGAVSSCAADPIEKKPFYHFHPGTFVFTAGSWSCNFGCPWCQNWAIARTGPPFNGAYISPERFVEMAENANCQGVAISYNEPTLSLEWSLDVFRLARRRELYNAYVTNGYMTPDALFMLLEAGLDAMNVDVKGDAAAVRKYCKGVDVEKVWNICRLSVERDVHLEITTLVIPTVNDGDAVLRGIAESIVRELGADIPWHVSGYYPAYQFTAPPTPLQTLEGAWQIGNEAGLKFVYVGNLPGHRRDNTYCPACGFLLIRRVGFSVRENQLSGGLCPRCRAVVAGIWETSATLV